MKNLLIAFSLLIALGASAQQRFNPVLKKQLDSVLILDQKYRDTLTWLMTPGKSDSIPELRSLSASKAMSHYWTLQNRADSANVVFVERLFKTYGYPGKTLVGEPANEAAWYVIQHSPKIDQYLPMMKKAAESKELPFRLYAMMLDRQLMNQHKEQVYGTQATSAAFKNGKKIGWYIWPIKDAAGVNERRKQAGFDQTVEENAKRLGVDYKVIRIEEVN